MCFIKVKEEEDYTVPARIVRRRSISPRRSTRISRTIIEERRPSPRSSYVIPAPAPPASLPPPQPEPVFVELPPPAPSTRAPSRAPSRVPSRAPSKARSARTTTRSHFVEVEESSSSSSSSDEEEEEIRSRATSKHSKSATTRAPSTKAGSGYHIREKEYRRERGYSKPQEEYETFRYIEAPDRDREARASFSRDRRSVDDPRASRTSYRRGRERIVIADDDGRRRRDYRP